MPLAGHWEKMSSVANSMLLPFEQSVGKLRRGRHFARVFTEVQISSFILRYNIPYILPYDATCFR